MKQLSYLLSGFLLLGLIACSSSEEKGAQNAPQTPTSTQQATPSQPVPTPKAHEPYVIEDSSKLVPLDQGVMLYVVKEGSGAIPKPSSNVIIHYHGMLTNGTVFDSSFDRGETADFPLQNLIRGWQIGLTKVKSGSKIKLIIPPEVGYGATGSSNIPPNSTLVFDIDLISTY